MFNIKKRNFCLVSVLHLLCEHGRPLRRALGKKVCALIRKEPTSNAEALRIFFSYSSAALVFKEVSPLCPSIHTELIQLPISRRKN